MEQATVAYVGLGANCEEARHMLAEAGERLKCLPGVTLLAASTVYVTQPQGYADQPWFLNQALKLGLEAAWRPQAFVRALLEIEAVMGRVRDPSLRFGPRVIDLDLLLFGEERCAEADSTVPHPRLTQRAFVLVPLLELDPNLHIEGQALADALQNLSYRLCGNKIFQ